jgi:hypothetical protein
MAGLTITSVKIDELRANTWNPNEQTPRVREAVLESITEFGFLDPVLVRPHPDGAGYEIVDGEHRWEAALAAGDTHLDVIVRDLTDQQAKRLTVILNETRGQADTIGLAQLLAELDADIGTDALLVGLPYTGDELADLVRMADIDWGHQEIRRGGQVDAKRRSNGDDAGWHTIPLRVTDAQHGVLAAAWERYWDGKDRPAEDVAWGLLVEHLAADYLAGPS